MSAMDFQDFRNVLGVANQLTTHHERAPNLGLVPFLEIWPLPCHSRTLKRATLLGTGVVGLIGLLRKRVAYMGRGQIHEGLRGALMRREIIAFCLLFASLEPLTAQNRACLTRLDLTGDLRQYKGQYRNGAYSYATRIPAGLMGVDPKNPFYQKGFSIQPLGGGYLTVFAEVNSVPYKNPQAAAQDHLNDLKSNFGSVASVRCRDLQLASRPAVQATAVLRCPGQKATFTDTSLFALSSSGRFVYTITWQGPDTGKAAGIETMRAIRRGWRFLPRNSRGRNTPHRLQSPRPASRLPAWDVGDSSPAPTRPL